MHTGTLFCWANMLSVPRVLSRGRSLCASLLVHRLLESMHWVRTTPRASPLVPHRLGVFFFFRAPRASAAPPRRHPRPSPGTRTRRHWQNAAPSAAGAAARHRASPAARSRCRAASANAAFIAPGCLLPATSKFCGFLHGTQEMSSCLASAARMEHAANAAPSLAPRGLLESSAHR